MTNRNSKTSPYITLFVNTFSYSHINSRFRVLIRRNLRIKKESSLFSLRGLQFDIIYEISYNTLLALNDQFTSSLYDDLSIVVHDEVLHIQACTILNGKYLLVISVTGNDLEFAKVNSTRSNLSIGLREQSPCSVYRIVLIAQSGDVCPRSISRLSRSSTFGNNNGCLATNCYCCYVIIVIAREEIIHLSRSAYFVSILVLLGNYNLSTIITTKNSNSCVCNIALIFGYLRERNCSLRTSLNNTTFDNKVLHLSCITVSLRFLNSKSVR